MVIVSDVAGLLLDPHLWLVLLASAVFGLFMGAVPGLTALMATALMVPIVMFMEPVPAIGAIITASAMAIFAGDIPGALMRMPGTPASAAYTDDSYALTRAGKAGLSLGAGLFSSVIGGLLSAVVLTFAAPSLAELALNFSSVEYFWLGVLGISCAIFIGGRSLLKGLASLLFGLALSTVGMDPVAGTPRFTFGSSDLLGGLGLIPVLIGLFAISELLRGSFNRAALAAARPSMGEICAGMSRTLWNHRGGLARGSGIGTLIGALPGAGADIAAWVSYALERQLQLRRKQPETDAAKVERIMSAGAANNAALGGAYIPATVFGIPGDAITAIVISVMFLKGVNPGPTIFLNNPGIIYAIFAIFFIANLIMIPLGLACIRAYGLILKVPTLYLSPTILLFCIVGAFSADNTLFGVGVMLAFGLLGYLMEANDIPLAPAILGLILGPMLEQTFMTTMLKSSGDLIAFFDRPIGGTLGVLTLGAWGLAIGLRLVRSWRRPPADQFERA
jgi:putative tricarboxylic transport membrane protein